MTQASRIVNIQGFKRISAIKLQNGPAKFLEFQIHGGEKYRYVVAGINSASNYAIQQIPKDGSRTKYESLRIWLFRMASLLGHAEGIFYQIGCDRESVGRSNRLLEFTRISSIGGI